jgi:Periplasmic copper-binding protein (NosD)
MNARIAPNNDMADESPVASQTGICRMRPRPGLTSRARRISTTEDRPRTGARNSAGWLLLAVTAVLGLQAVTAHAQVASTYVSGKGKDSNPCTATSPCKTLQRAVDYTIAGGQVFALDSANYGYVTVNKAVNIVSGRGITGVLATSGVTGITIAAGANDRIHLQGLEIDGAGTGTNGIQFSSGASLTIQDSVIRGFANGINFQSTNPSNLSVEGTLIAGNGTGIVFQSSAAGIGALNDVQVVNNGSGIVARGASSSAIARMSVQNSIVANNDTVGLLSAGFSTISVAFTTIANNGVGVEAQTSSGLLQVSQSTVFGNATGWKVTNGGQVISSANNAFGGNISGGSAPPTTVAATPTPPPVNTNYLTDGQGGYLLDTNGRKVTAL